MVFLFCMFYILFKQSIYFHVALSYSAYAIATLVYHLPCVSRWICDAAFWQQTLLYSQLKCGSVCAMQPRLGISVSPIAFFMFLMLSHKMTSPRCLSLFHTRSASRLLVLHALLYETHETSVHTGPLQPKMWSQCNVMPRWWNSKTPDDEENPDPLPQRWAGYPERWIQLPSL